MDIQMSTLPRLAPELQRFQKIYQFHKLILCPAVPNKDWKPREERTCRFCKKRHPEVSFKSDSHHLPEFLGNKHLIFQEECDTCNARFAIYESHFHAYLGIMLTFFSAKGKKNKVPKFKVNPSTLTATQKRFFGIDAIVLEKNNQPFATINVETGSVELKFVKQSYIPLKAYKCLLKIAATSIEDEEVQTYDYLFHFLLTEQFDRELSKLAVVKEYLLPVTLPYPRVYLFKTLEHRSHYPTHMCMLYFNNLAYQFMIPGNLNDAYMNGGTSSIIYCPPLFDFLIGNIYFQERVVRLGSTEKRRNEEGTLHFQTDPAKLKQMKAYDPKTKRESNIQFNPNEVIKMIIGNINDKLDLQIDHE